MNQVNVDAEVAGRVLICMSDARVDAPTVAAALGITELTLTRRLSSTRSFTITDLVKIADVVGRPLGDLLPSPKGAQGAA